jgi:acetyltransferase-like isoleucine patch superfamily enzyme
MIFRIFRRLIMLIKLRKFKKRGKNIVFDPFSRLSYSTITLGSNIYIGPNAFFSSTHSNISIGNNTIFGPNVSIYGGDHIFDKVGVLLNTVEKNIDHKDMDVVIGHEVWIAGNVVILSGVTIGDGAIIGASSVVTKDIDAYSINVGNPCQKIKSRFSEADIKKHIEQTSS